MVKSLTASLVSREEEERHQRNLNDDEQLKNQIAEGVTCQTSSDESGKQGPSAQGYLLNSWTLVSLFN
ncbi:hypothetical protein RRG08_041087 [Elysia crispata]|uniref:Uncharacterized protein n=1 Tax=Elysia crispata TaxID=231223 RepID=A0AAE0Y862_9GAST|nr:hypothetical protein RRG08_041087 [Elysia crispata]